MRTLQQAIIERGGKNANAILSYMTAAGLNDWNDCTDLGLSDFVLYLQNETSLTDSSIYYYAHQLQAILNKYKGEGIIPANNINEALVCHNDRSQKVYLNKEELRKFEEHKARNASERYCQLGFLIGTRTGMRISDILRTTEENIVEVNGQLRFVYVSKKTHIEVNLPISEKVAGWIKEFVSSPVSVPERTYIYNCKSLCRKAGIRAKIKLYKAGKERIREKWEYVGSHTARVSFCTNLYLSGVSAESIAKLAGHTNASMTWRYIATTDALLSDKGMDYLYGE